MARKNNKTDKQKYALAEETNKRLGLISTVLARNSARVKQLQEENVESSKTTVSSKKNLLTLTTSLSIIASTLKRLNNTLSSLKSIKPITPGIIPIAAPTPAATTEPDKKDKKDSVVDLFKTLFTNPAVIAAVTGITYLFLPKEIKDKLGAFFKGFNDGLVEATGDDEGGLKKLSTNVKIAGVAIATIFGIKILGSIAEAIATTTKLIRMMGVKSKTAKKLGLAGALLAGGAAYAAVDAITSESDKDSASYNLDAAPDSVRKKYQGDLDGQGERQSPAATSPYPRTKKPAGVTNSAVDAIDFFTKKGWTFEQAAGIVGNLQVESGSNLDHTAYNKKEDAYGIAQWRGSRKEQFKKNYGKPIEESTFKEQLEFINWELNTDKTYRAAGAKLKEAKTASEAAAIFDKMYERSSGEHIDQRMMNAEELIRPLRENASVSPGATSSPVVQKNVTGQNINNVSTEIRRASQKPKTQTQVANIDNSKQKETGRENAAPLPVPSPIANRGSLLAFTKHSTAYS